MQFSESPLDPDPSEERGIEIFKELFWHNSEICNECFTQVRDIGPEYSRTLDRGSGDMSLDVPDLDMTTNEWFERTENGRQEHSPMDTNRRFGTCWCLNCGGDLTASHRDKSLGELTELADPIASYIDSESPHEIDRGQFTNELADLKTTPEFQSWETETLALAFARAVTPGQELADRQAIRV